MSSPYKHHTYAIPGLVDAAVLKAQAERRRDKYGESTVVHAHSAGGQCRVECRIYEAGYKTRSVAAERVPVMEGEEDVAST